MASKSFEERLLKEVTENAWKSYGRFVEKFNGAIESIHDQNLKYINLSADLTNYNDPGLADEASERTELTELLQTCGNVELNKVMLVFASLCSEMNYLAKVGLNEFVNPVALYGEGKTDSGGPEDGEELAEMSKLLPTLYRLLCFINRCFSVVKNLTQQLEALFNMWTKAKGSPNKPIVEVDGIRFNIVFDSLGRLAVALINLDEVLKNQAILRRDFVNYKRIIELISRDTSKFDVPDTDGYKVKTLAAVIVKVERDIIDGGSLLKRMIDSMVSASLDNSISKNNQVAEQLVGYVRSSVTQFEAETNKFKDDKKWLAINALFITYVWLFKKDDKRLFKVLLDSEKKTGLLLVHLKGNCFVFPDKVLTSHLPKSMVDKKAIDLINQQRDALLKQSNVEKEAKQINIRVVNWMVVFESVITVGQDSVSNLIESLLKQMKTLEEGIELALLCSTLVRNCVSLHLHFGRAMTKSDLVGVCKLITIMKAIGLSFARKKGAILLIMSTYSQYNSCIALSSLSSLKKRLLADVKKYSEKKLDVLSAIILASNCFHGPIQTETRLTLSSLCLAMVSPSMNDTETQKIMPSFIRIENCSKILLSVKQWTNCDFVYFNRSVFGVYFNFCYENELSNVRELRYFFHALADCLSLINEGCDDSKKQMMADKLEGEVWEQFKAEYLDRLCADFETELRLQVHIDLQLDDQSPFKRRLYNFSVPLSCEPIRMFNKFLSIKSHVESYLNEMAYNLTTIALHDWKTYESMLSLARNKYGLDFVTSQLPTQTLEQGLDVLEITRNIHIFVSRYLYNLNNQMFIERSSENKHLNVLLIRHVANSIQTHGYGVINTAVNFTYQFLRKKFYVFSQFLYEEHIKSRLMKDLRHFRESKSKSFPYERADKLVKGIRKLGLNAEGLSYLDQFRLLISQIGNALGFVRMLRSGALHCSSVSVNFVPDLDELAEIAFENMAKEEQVSDECIKAAHNLDTVLSTLNRNFSEATDYFNLLVQVFATTFRDPKNYHLNNFYAILPAITLNYVEYLIISKEKMTRKNKVGAAFTDDGFAMGVAYVLKLLDQYSEFDSLQWFSSVTNKVAVERNEAVKQRNMSISSNNPDQSLSQTTNLTLKRLELLQTEFDLLNYNLTSCRILFKGTLDAQN